MEEGIERSGAKVDFEPISDLKVDLISPARLALEKAENDEVKMVLHQSLSPRLVQILIQAGTVNSSVAFSVLSGLLVRLRCFS